MESFHILLAAAGAAGLGFVLGWTLYFANRGKSGDLSTSDLAAIAGVVAGGAVIGFLGDMGVAGTVRAAVFGAYGIGLVAGFLTYFRLLQQRLARTDDLGALETLAFETPARARAFKRKPSREDKRKDALEDLQRAQTASDEVASSLNDAQDDAVENNELDRYREIAAARRVLGKHRRALNMLIALEHLKDPELQEFLAVLERETANLESEAARMKQAAKNVQAVADLIGASNRSIDGIKSLLD